MPDPYPHRFNRYGKAFTDHLFGVRGHPATRQRAFETLCSTLSIDPRLAPPRPPQTNGMVERFNGRLEDITMFDQAKIWERRRTAVSGFQPHAGTISLRQQNALASHETRVQTHT